MFGIPNKVQKEYVDVCDINNSLKSILIDKMREHILKKTRTLPTDRVAIEDCFTNEFVDDLRSTIINYWRIAYENEVKCIISKGQFIDMYMTRDSA